MRSPAAVRLPGTLPPAMPSWIDDPRNLRGRRAVVMGLGVQAGGLGVAEFLRDRDAELVVTDLRDAEALAPSIARLGHDGVRYVLGGHDPRDFERAELVVRNPAVPLGSPLLRAAEASGAHIEMEMTLFLRWCAAGMVVGITGTRGKTTTATALHAMLVRAGRPAALAGNLRISALAQLPTIGPEHAVVLELSSWQVEGLGLTGLRTGGAIITNLMPDHLDRYASLEAYAAAKAPLVANQRPDDWSVLPSDDIWGEWFTERAGGRVTRYDRSSSPPGWAHARLRGDHDRANLTAAAAAAAELGVDTDTVARAVAQFPGVPARQEYVGSVNGVRIYNDTTATIPQATLAALDTIPGPWVVVAGGSDKRVNFDALAERLRVEPRLRALILLPGAGTDRLRERLGPADVIEAASMASAVDRALEAAQPDDAVVLSPACASFGLFTNEFDRGEQFVAAVRRHGPLAHG